MDQKEWGSGNGWCDNFFSPTIEKQAVNSIQLRSQTRGLSNEQLEKLLQTLGFIARSYWYNGPHGKRTGRVTKNEMISMCREVLNECNVGWQQFYAVKDSSENGIGYNG